MERFYSKVNAIVHNRNLMKDSIIVEEKAEAEQYKKALRLAYLEDAARELQRRIDLIMVGQEEENTHEIALSGDVNELVEEIDDAEIVDDDDDDENSDDEVDGDN